MLSVQLKVKNGKFFSRSIHQQITGNLLFIRNFDKLLVVCAQMALILARKNRGKTEKCTRTFSQQMFFIKFSFDKHTYIDTKHQLSHFWMYSRCNSRLAAAFFCFSVFCQWRGGERRAKSQRQCYVQWICNELMLEESVKFGFLTDYFHFSFLLLGTTVTNISVNVNFEQDKIFFMLSSWLYSFNWFM